MLALNIFCFRSNLPVIYLSVLSQKNKSNFNTVWCEICLKLLLSGPKSKQMYPFNLYLEKKRLN